MTPSYFAEMMPFPFQRCSVFSGGDYTAPQLALWHGQVEEGQTAQSTGPRLYVYFTYNGNGTESGVTFDLRVIEGGRSGAK